MKARFLNDEVLPRKREQVERDRARVSRDELIRICRDLPPALSFFDALKSSRGIIAEIKVKSPSKGEMRKENLEDAPRAYETSPIVRALSILTDEPFFGQSIETLRDIRKRVTKPILRKDFIIDAYQIYEARAAGADAILLMATILSPAELRELYDVAKEVGVDVLFEAHDAWEIESFPEDARICGVNSRELNTGKLAEIAKSKELQSQSDDLSLNTALHSDLVDQLPADSVKVAESGVSPDTIKGILEAGYDAALIGTSLLTHPEGVIACLAEFEAVLID